MKLYIAKTNTDQTEGKGSMRPVGYFMTEQAAYEAVKGQGVMGVGDGEVWSLDVSEDDSGRFTESKVYGHHRRGNTWREGWVDGRDLTREQIDPDYAMYLRLKNRYENV